MIDKNKVYAIVGASKNSSKYGHKVFKDLKESGYSAIPINPNGQEILGIKAFKSILGVKKKIDVVIFVVPPEVTEEALKDVKKLKIKAVWLQPGSESEKAIKYCKENKINCVHDSCIMVSKS